MSRTSVWWAFGLAIAAVFIWAWPYRGLPAQWVAVSKTDRPLAAAKSWRYQLDHIDIDELAADMSDLLVIDYAKKEGKVPILPGEVERMKRRPDGSRRFVVAYLSVGESEEFRFYWNKNWTAPATEPVPDWIGEENCAWPKAHRVRYWSEAWKVINFRGADSYLRRVIDAGFDGVYLDRVDIYETFEKERPTARRDMIDHVAALAATARRLKPGFFIVPQNAEALLDAADYRLVIDGLGKESLLHGATETGKRNAQKDIQWSLKKLRRLQDEGKPVFAVEYLTNAGNIDATATELRQRGFIPAFEARALDGTDPTRPVDLVHEVGTPERTTKECPPGTSW